MTTRSIRDVALEAVAKTSAPAICVWSASQVYWAWFDSAKDAYDTMVACEFPAQAYAKDDEGTWREVLMQPVFGEPL